MVCLTRLRNKKSYFECITEDSKTSKLLKVPQRQFKIYIIEERWLIFFLSLIQIKSNLSLHSLDYAEACNELAGSISALLRPCNTAPFEKKSQRWRAVGNTVSDLTGPRFEPQTSRSRDERVTARPTGRFFR